LVSLICVVFINGSLVWFWQIGRIPNEWARCLLPLVRDHKVRIEGKCKFGPQVLGIMDSIVLLVRYVMFNAKWHTYFVTSLYEGFRFIY